jgi:ketosteroid isomerase-like protein
MQSELKSPPHAYAAMVACRIPPLAFLVVALASMISSAALAKKQTGPPKAPAVAADAAVAAAQRPGTGADVDAIRRIIATYAKSVDDADTTLASQVWWDSPEVSFIHPLGHEHGFDRIKQNVYTRLMGETFSERKLTPRDIAVHVYGDSAWAEFYWDFNAKFRKDGQPITTHGRETQIYRKFPSGWRLVHVHYSGMPTTQPGQGL